MDVAPLPDSGCDDESSSPPPQAANNKATMDAHIHMNSCFIVSPNKLFNLYAWPPVLSSGQAPYCDAAETSLNHRDQAITRAHENERTGFTGLSSRASCGCQRGHGVRQRPSEGAPSPGFLWPDPGSHRGYGYSTFKTAWALNTPGCGRAPVPTGAA
ncbi:hypothetical protein D3C80_1081360 [compost metagenome]